MTGDTTVSSPTTSPTRRGTRRRAAQEADWDLKGAEDARQLLYEREVAWKYGALTARAINAYWRVDTLLRGQAQAGSPLAAVPTCLLAAVAAWAEGSGADAVAAEAARRRDAFQAPRARGVRVFARIRPAYDASRPEVVERAEASGVVLHDARLAVRFLELSGKKDCRDLLNDGAPVKLLSDADEKIHFVGATVRAATTAAELRGALEAGLRLRASEETERNAASSRSHAVVQVLAPDGRALTLVDLAGSERKWETMGMRSRAQNRESADINLSLMALRTASGRRTTAGACPTGRRA
ncbi:hypothetical protein JL722_6635 [Aureococcus anophagefferens]|nr:hypothetical protein JL722_6635 [Aureococcus anophagefferens]